MIENCFENLGFLKRVRDHLLFYDGIPYESRPHLAIDQECLGDWDQERRQHAAWKNGAGGFCMLMLLTEGPERDLFEYHFDRFAHVFF